MLRVREQLVLAASSFGARAWRVSWHILILTLCFLRAFVVVLSPREPFLRSTPTIILTIATCLYPFPPPLLRGSRRYVRIPLRQQGESCCVFARVSCVCVRACVRVCFLARKGAYANAGGDSLGIVPREGRGLVRTPEKGEKEGDSPRTREWER